MLELVPDLRWVLKPTVGASHGGVELAPPLHEAGAIVRFTRLPGAMTVAADELDRDDAAWLCEGVDRLALFVEYDEAGHMTHLVETDAWLNGKVEREIRHRWSHGRPLLRSWSEPYTESQRRTEFTWDEDGRLRGVRHKVTGQPALVTELGYVDDRVRTLTLHRDRVRLRSAEIERDEEGRVRLIEWTGSTNSTKLGWCDRQRSTSTYRWLGAGEVQRIRFVEGEWSGLHWRPSSNGEGTMVWFSPEDDDALAVTRLRFHGGLRELRRGLVRRDEPIRLEAYIDPEQLLSAELELVSVSPIGPFWPQQQELDQVTWRDRFVFESDGRGNWLRAGRVDPETGDRVTQYERVIEYR